MPVTRSEMMFFAAGAALGLPLRELAPFEAEVRACRGGRDRRGQLGSG